MLKMGLHDPFGHLKHKLWPKEGPGVKTNFLACRWHAAYRWKTLDERYNFALNITLIGGLHTKLCTSKVTEVPILRISGLPLWSPGIKCHLVLAPWPSTKYTIKGKVVASPKSGL